MREPEPTEMVKSITVTAGGETATEIRLFQIENEDDKGYSVEVLTEKAIDRMGG